MSVDSNFRGFISSSKSPVPTASLLSLQILAISVVHHRGKILKQMNIKEVVRGEGLAVSTLDYPMLKKKKRKKLFYLWMDGTYSSLHSCLLYTVLQLAWACMFWVGNVLSCQLLFSWKRRANTNTLLFHTYDFLGYDFLPLVALLHAEYLPFLREWKSS